MKTFTLRLATFIKYSLIITMLLGSMVNAYAQSHRVSGTITHDGVPLLGATIMIKDTHRGTTSNMDGYFELTANDDDTLVVSYLGYETKEIPLQGRTTIDIELTADADMLDAVEITGGYYSLEERTRTGNVTKIDTDQFEQQVVHSPMEALQGRVAGLEIETRTGLSGQAPLVTLRGQGSIRAFGDTPLYIIDGVPIDNQGLLRTGASVYGSTGIDPLATLEPSVIESIEVLKDADATAIYGSRGANGVIIINTKRGQAGKTKFEFHTERGVSWVGKFIDLMNTEQYLEMRREAFENDGVEPNEGNAPDLLLWGQNRYTDWQKELIGGNAEFEKYQVSVSGGNEQTAFLLSGGFQKETTVFPGDFNFQSNNLLANINHRSLDNKLQLNTSINYGYKKSNLFSISNFVDTVVRLPANNPTLFDEEGNVNWELDDFGNPTLINAFAGFKTPSTLRLKSFQWSGNLSYKFFKGLTSKVNIGINQLQQNDKELFYKENINPLYATTARSVVNQRLASREHFVIEPQVQYNFQSNKHRFSTIIGTTFQKNRQTNLHLTGQRYFSEAQVGNIGLAEDKNVLGDEVTDYRYAALFGRMGYSFDDRYHLNFTGRRDGSSRFGRKSRFGNFGAIGMSWEFSKEDFIKNFLPEISYGKVKGSFGTTGSDNIGDYQYRDTYSQIRTRAGSISKGGLIPSKLYNSYYHWEKNTKLELAIDLGLWSDIIQLSASWYRERSGNQLVGLQLPSTTGFSSVQGNLAAKVQNTGWEIVLQTIPIQTKNFLWTSNINLTVPKNKLIDFPDLESSSYASQFELGKPLRIRKLFNYTGIDPETGEYTFRDINNDGVLNIEDQIVHVDLSRKYYGGWSNNLQYKDWNLSFLFEFVKQKGMNPFRDLGIPGGQTNMATEVLDRWQSPGDYNREYQRFTQLYDSNYFNYTASDVNVRKASFIRMKSISLNYQLMSKLLYKIGIREAQVYINAQNLFTLTQYKGFDAQSAGGIELPALTSVQIGFKITL